MSGLCENKSRIDQKNVKLNEIQREMLREDEKIKKFSKIIQVPEDYLERIRDSRFPSLVQYLYKS